MPKNAYVPPAAHPAAERMALGVQLARGTAPSHLGGFSSPIDSEPSGSLDQWGLQVCSCADVEMARVLPTVGPLCGCAEFSE